MFWTPLHCLGSVQGAPVLRRLLIGDVEVRCQVGETDEVEPTNPDAISPVEEMLSLEPNACDVGFFTCCAKKFRTIDGKETPCPQKAPESARACSSI